MATKRQVELKWTRRQAIGVAIAIGMVCATAGLALSQDGGQITSWGLVQVITGETGDNMCYLYPTEWSRIRADSTGGEILYVTRLSTNESCYIQSRLRWVFDRDVSRVN